MARASGWAARPWERSPLDHDRPESTVEMMGEKVKSFEGRTPTESELPAVASTSPPLVATAVACTLSDHDVEPSAR